ncbi:MAG: leucine-rich repeat protein [Candidatus Coproplasma sp.]
MQGLKRKKSWLICALAAVILACASVAGVLIYREVSLNRWQQQALQTLEEDIGTYDENTIVLTDTNVSTAQNLAQKLGASLRITSNGSFATLTLPEGQTVKDVYENDSNRELLSKFSLDYYSSTSEVEEESSERLPSSPNYTVTDTQYSNQSYINYVNIGDSWNSYRGNGITVAVIDTGIDTDHPEFAGKISEYSYNASYDKIVKDYTLENGEYDWSLIEDQQGHGTAVSGVIASSMDGEGVVGIAPEVTLLVIKAECDENGGFYRTSDLVFGLYYAVERDVDVVNMSFGSYVPVNPFAQATKLAVDSDIICVAAAGNDATATICYPAADENVISVGALAEDSWELAAYSNYGENSDIVAPGSTYTAKKGGGYGMIKGTSLASPIVAGAMALLKSQDRYMEFSDAKELLFASCYDLGSLGEDWYFGYGALDISALIREERGTVTFDMLTDELEDITQVFIRNHTLQDIPEPERNYAVFDGWYYDIDCKEELNLYEDIWNSDLTLYANWVNEDDGVPYTYVTLEDGTVEIRSYTGHRRYITIPDKIDGKTVSSIGDFAFDGQNRLRQINLPSGLTNIGICAFRNCNNLTEIILPDGLKSIGTGAFQNAVRMRTVGISSDSALESIGMFAFSGSGITKFDVTKNVSALNGSAFFGATSLKSINVSKENTAFRSESGVLLNATGSKIIAFPAGLNATYVLPESVTDIGDYAFSYAKFKGIELDGVQRIGNYAFAYSSLESIGITDSVVSMGGAAFAYNFNLKTATIGNGLTAVPKEAFVCDFSLTEIVIPSGIVAIGESAFKNTGLNKLTFAGNSNLMEIGANAFTMTAIERVNLPASLIVVNSEAFSKIYALTEVTFAAGSNLQYIGGSAFEGDVSVTEIILPDSLIQIGDYAFKDSGITGSVTIPANVVALGAGVFASCHSLTEIKVDEANAVYLDVNGVVYNADKTLLVEYPAGNTATEYTLESTTETVYDSAFYGSANLNYVYLPQSLVSIQQYAFYEVSNLLSINMPDNVTQISNYAFANDYNLRHIYFTDNSKLPRISFAAFAYTGIYSFYVPANVSTIAQYAFEGCNDLNDVVFAANSKLDIIPAYMLKGADNLTRITFESGSALTSISAHGFEGMSRLQSVDFGDAKLTNIDNYAFRYCDSLQTLTIPEGVTYIGRFAFYGDKSLTRLDVPASVDYIGRYAFYGAENLNIYFTSSSLPENLQEDWDKGIAGYYVGVTNVIDNGDWQYATLSDGGISIISYTGTETLLDLTTLDLGGDIRQIGGYAFYRSQVTSITLPETLTQIQRYAFAYSDIQSITIPANVSFIGQYAFYYTAISQVTFAQGSSLQKIEQHAFSENKYLTQITIPASVKELGTYAFYNSAIESVTFESGSGLTTIPAHAFANTKLDSVTIPDSVNCIDDNAFRDCLSLNTLTLGSADNLQVHANAFYNTDITTLNIPANLEYIGEYAFVGLQNLTAYNVDANNAKYKSVDGVLYNKDGSKLITFPAGREGSFTVPKSVETIGFGAFENTKLESVDFESGINLLTLGYRAFYNAQNLTTVSIPASVVSIDYYAFAMCGKLETVNFAKDNKLTGIYEGAFYGCNNLKNIVIPDSIIEISDFAFYGCSSLTSLPISQTSNLKGIFDYAFAYTGITELTIPETVIDIGAYAFRGARLKTVVIPNANAQQLIIGIGAFADCNDLVEITLPFIGASFEDAEISWFGYIFGAGGYQANSTYIPESLKTVTITEGINAIGTGAFYGIQSMEKINLPESITMVYSYSFCNCSAKYSFVNAISVEGNVIDGTFFQAYRSAGGYSIYYVGGISGTLTLADGITRIEQNAFTGCANLVKIILPQSLEYIASYSLASCSSLTEVEFAENINITTIGGRVFYWTGLKTIEIPASVTTIEDYAFEGCENLVEVINHSDLIFEIGSDSYGEVAKNAKVIIDKNGKKIYKDEVTDLVYIEADMFRFVKENETFKLVAYMGNKETVTLPEYVEYNGVKNDYIIFQMTGGKNLIVPEGVKEIGESAFKNNYSIISVRIADSVESIGKFAFCYCQNLKYVYFGENSRLESIGQQAFVNCMALKEICLPENLQTVGMGAFTYCTSLSKVSIGSKVDNIDSYTFERCGELSELVISPENQSVTLIDGILFDKDKTNIIWISADVKKVVVPSTVSGYSVSGYDSIEEVRFEEGFKYLSQASMMTCANVKDIYIPASVTNFGQHSVGGNSTSTVNVYYAGTLQSWCEIKKTIYWFTGYGYNLYINGELVEEIEFTDQTEIPAYSFNYCKSIKRITIGSNVTDIASMAFMQCTNLTEVIYSGNSNLTTIGSSAFGGCISLLEITLPQGLTSLGMQSFNYCTNLYKIVNNSSIVLDFENEIEASYEGSGITLFAKIIIDKDGNKLFKEEGSEFEYVDTADGFRFMKESDGYTLVAYLGGEGKVTLPDYIMGETYGIYLMKGVKDIVIPATVETIGYQAFYECNTLRSVEILDGVTAISEYAFNKCANLESVIIPDSVVSIAYNSFQDTPFLNNKENYVDGCLYSGKALIRVDTEAKYVHIKEDTTCFARNAFNMCYSLLEVSATGNNFDLFDTLTNLETLIITELPTENTAYHYFGSMFSIPITLKNIVLKKGCDLHSTDMFQFFTNVNIFVEEEKYNVMWDDDLPNWSNGNKVYYGGEWINVVFKDANGNVISSDYYTTSQVIRQPYVAPVIDGATKTVLMGWDIDGDGVADSVPATSTKNISATAVMMDTYNTFTVNYYGIDGELLASQSYLYGDEIVLPEEPTKQGYAFSAWDSYIQGMTVTEDINLYSVWTHYGGGHSYEKIDIVLPTCSEQGYDKYVCSICGDEYHDNFVEALGHSFGEWIVEAEATCLTDGLRYRICSVCNEREEEVIEAMGHSYAGTITLKPTCTEKGEITYTCRHCSDVKVEQLQEIDHNYTKELISISWIKILKEEVSNAYFGYEGEGAYYYRCADCGYVMTSEGIASLSSAQSACEHVAGDWETSREPGCADGIAVRKCTICGKVLESKTLAATGEHIYGEWYESVAPGCTEDGIERHDCIYCDNYETRVVSANGHTNATAVEENRVEATCTTDGHYDSVVYCSVCGDELSREEKTLTALGHDLVHHEAKAPTCTEIGWEAYDTCSRCDYSINYKELSALGHDYDYENIVWSWSEDYSTATGTVKCKNDNSHTETFTAVVTSQTTEATETEEGETVYTATITVNDQTYTVEKTVKIPVKDEPGNDEPGNDEPGDEEHKSSGCGGLIGGDMGGGDGMVVGASLLISVLLVVFLSLRKRKH